MNIYEQFINYCKQTVFSDDYKENHHIIPKHAGGSNDPTNLIALPFYEHKLAHYYRWLAYDSFKDKYAYLLMNKMNAEAKQLIIQQSIETHRKNKTNFFNREFQIIQGKKGCYKGGVANTEKQYLARQKVGKKYGSENGLKNTSNEIIINFRQYWSKWEHQSGIEIIIPPQQSLSALQKVLQEHFYFEVKNKSSVRRVILGIKKSIGGWHYINKAISRQALDTSKEASETTGEV